MKLACRDLFWSLMLLVASGAVVGAECNRELVDATQQNKALTTLQKDAFLDEACLGKTVLVRGRVIDVEYKNGFDLAGYDGFEYGVRLIPGHECGDLLRMEKGQQVTVSGRVNKIFWYTHKNLENSNCR